jgi:ubiquinone/menaquinone biosynthesis C-methylase UbiE
MSRLRRWYMQLTNVSRRWGHVPRYVRTLYWIWSRFYDLSIAWDPAFRANASRMVQSTVRPGDRVLDVGIGTGLLAEYGSSIAADYVGVDVSPAMLGRAARKIVVMEMANVALRFGRADSLPFEDGSFDVVISSFMLPHIARDQRTAVLAEMRRVLTPGGRLGLFLAQGEIAPLFSTREELERYLAEAGYVSLRIEDHDDVYRIVTAISPEEHTILT